LETADFYEFYGATVECPYCEAENELDVGQSQYNEGDSVTCRYCEKEFELGISR